MTILTKREVWRKPRPTDKTRRSSDLTPDEQANVRKALRFLAVRLGDWPKLAQAMKANQATVWAAGWKRGVSAGIAVRAARVAGVPVEEILSGRWPKPNACPMCGRCDETPDSAGRS